MKTSDKSASPRKRPLPRRDNAVVDRKAADALSLHERKMAIQRDPKQSGRLCIWDASMADLVTKLCMLGLTNSELAKALGITESTVDTWLAEDNATDTSSFSGAVRAGREIADAKVAGSLYARAVGYEYDEQVAVSVGSGRVVLTTVRKKLPPDVNAAFLWLKNRRRREWKDNHKDEDSDPLEVAQAVRYAVAAALGVTGQAPAELPHTPTPKPEDAK